MLLSAAGYLTGKCALRVYVTFLVGHLLPISLCSRLRHALRSLTFSSSLQACSVSAFAPLPQLAALSLSSPGDDHTAFERSMAVAVPSLYKAMDSSLDAEDDTKDETRDVRLKLFISLRTFASLHKAF